MTTKSLYTDITPQPKLNSVLITGGSGFIGSHLARTLVEAGHKVYVLDKVSPFNRIENVFYRQGDASREHDVLAMLPVDCVFHLAAMVSVPECEKNPREAYRNNFETTLAVLESIKRCSPHTKVVFSSTCALYGSIGPEEVARETDEIRPESTYAMTKWLSEKLIHYYHYQHNVSSQIFRFFNVCGPGQDPRSPYSGVITQFRSRLAQGQNLVVYGDGSQTRDFIHVRDIVRGLILAMNSPESRGVINLGTGKSISILSLARIMTGGKDDAIEFQPPRPGDVLHSKASIFAAKKRLMWKPELFPENPQFWQTGESDADEGLEFKAEK